MAMKEYSLENLHQIRGGELGALFDLAVAQLLADLEDRPMLKADRTLTLTLKFAPAPLARDLEGVRVTPVVSVTLPKKELVSTDTVVRRISRMGKNVPVMTFNDMSEGDAKQRTIDEMDNS